jgi:hypothetical protein
MSQKINRLFLVAIPMAVFSSLLLKTQSSASPTDTKIPQSLNVCIPSQQVAKVELVGAVQKARETFYLLNAYEQNDPYPTDLVISVDERSQCSQLVYNPTGDPIRFSDFMPMDVARSLVSYRLKDEIAQAGGKPAYQKLLNKRATQGISYWSPEEIFVLQQLGFAIPNNFRIIDSSEGTSPMPQE